MTNYNFKNLLKIDIKGKDEGYVSKARLVEFHYNAQDVPMALVFNEETKRFKNIPVYDILRVYENPENDAENDELTEMWVRLFGDDAGVMDTFRNKYTIRKENDSVIISPKDENDKTEYVLVREMNDAEKSVLEQIEGVDKRTAHDINEMRLEKYRAEQGKIFKNPKEEIRYALGDVPDEQTNCSTTTNSIPVDSTKSCKSVVEFEKEMTRVLGENICPEVDKESVKQLKESCLADDKLMSKSKEYYANSTQTEEPQTEYVPDEEWKYNGGSC